MRTGLTAIGDAPAAPAYAGDLLWLSRYLATAFAGRVHEAEAIALTHRDHAARVADPALGMWEFAAAELALHAGRLEHAQALAARAERHLAWRDFTGLGPAATALRAAVEARLGRRTAASELLLGVTDDHRADVKVELHVSRVRAEEELRAGRRRSARDLLATSGTLALEQGHAYLGLLTLDEAFMVLPSPDLAAVLDGESGRSDLVAALAVRACAVAEGDADLTARSALSSARSA